MGVKQRRRRYASSTQILSLLVALTPASFQMLVAESKSWHRRMLFTVTLRGGSSSSADSEEYGSSIRESIESNETLIELPSVEATDVAAIKSSPSRSNSRRHASDLINNLLDKSLGDKSAGLRDLIMQRTSEYIQKLDDHNNDDYKKLQDPRKLLHYLAPKIPAIKHSPDIALRIQAARTDIDPGIAACLLGVLGHVCELYDDRRKALDPSQQFVPISAQMAKDRRLEQLIECVLCGINVKQRTEEFTMQNLDHNVKPDCIEEILDTEEVKATGGLSIRDASRAAWGISILGLHEHETIGEEKPEDLLIALSLRVRELLLARLQSIRQDDLAWGEGGLDQNTLDVWSDELARDAASTAWAFACVRAYTGIRFAPLFEVCCSILCQDPYDLRRRAQDVEAAIHMGNIGTNDAVERLARSEAAETQEDVNSQAVFRSDSENSDNKHSLIDWLSPNELTDVLWAIALHGRSDYMNQDEMALSETTTAFREVAFDRLLVWLKAELDVVRTSLDQGEQILLEDHNNLEDSHTVSEELTSVELVDAASLLQSERDALEATMLAETVLSSSNPSQEVVVMDSTSGSTSCASIDYPKALERQLSLTRSEYVIESHSKSDSRVFSNHDLCSIAWTVTELQDPVRDTVVETIVETFAHLGAESLRQLPMGDLSNFAWAVAKSVDENPSTTGEQVVSMCSAMAEAVLNAAHYSTYDNNAVPFELSATCHPPELSRLIWALVTIRTKASRACEAPIEPLQSLARVALLTAANNLQMYGTEDVARIAWGYLELVNNDSETDFDANEAIGKALATIDMALQQWESCSDMPATVDGLSQQSAKQPLNFKSFFGKPNAMLLDNQRLEQESVIDGDAHSIITRKPRPLLKDLPVDPSTLCKFLCSLTKFASNNIWICGGDSLMRVVLRLLSSKNGRLLRECPLFDLARLCGAVAGTTGRATIGRERIAHFVRRVAQYLNEFKCDDDKLLAPPESAKLLWSLGELGVKYNAQMSDFQAAHRRLELVSSMTFLMTSQFDELTDRRLAKLLRGVVTTKLLIAKPSYAITVIHHITRRLQSGYSVAIICDLTETIALVNEAISDELESDRVAATNNISNETNSGETEKTTLPDQSVILSELCASTEMLMAELAKVTITLLNTMTVVELRRLLTVYALSPIKVDEVVNKINDVVTTRRKILKDTLQGGVELNECIANVTYQAQQIQKSIKVNAETGTGAFSGKLKSIFGLSQTREVDMDNDRFLQIIANICDVPVKTEAASGICPLKTTNRIYQATFFELGRCSELIDQYHRIDFASGQLRSRLDKEFQSDLAKRLLSRALP
ncbi:hypothetical protein MPSEU_000603300 [Mayamaea pseudoterrestris]|nr:hypothetical protein MPSEU_000603300 [Mayamaea pseudoterrestris]